MIAREAIRGVKGRPWMDLAPMRSVAGRGTSEKKNGGEEGGRKEGVRERNRASPLGGCHLPRLEESRKIRGKNQAAANHHATRVQRFFFKVSFPPYRLDNSGGKGTANVLEFSKLVTQLLVSGLFLHAIWFLFFFSLPLFSFVSLYAIWILRESIFSSFFYFFFFFFFLFFFLLFFSYCDFNFLINF